MNKKISDKDKKDWQNFISDKKKLPNKDFNLRNNQNKNNVIKTLDLHGFTLDEANNVIERFIKIIKPKSRNLLKNLYNSTS